MNRLNFGRLSGTIVDVCRGHGTFLDAGELHAVVTFIQQGGLDRMRAREIDDLKEEQRRLRDVQSDAAGRRITPTRGSSCARHLDPSDILESSTGSSRLVTDQKSAESRQEFSSDHRFVRLFPDLSPGSQSGSNFSATPLMQ